MASIIIMQLRNTASISECLQFLLQLAQHTSKAKFSFDAFLFSFF